MVLEFDFVSFIEWVKYERNITLKIGLREAAKQIGISAATLSRYENGKIPDLIGYSKVCEWLNVSLDTFFIKSKKAKKVY